MAIGTNNTVQTFPLGNLNTTLGGFFTQQNSLSTLNPQDDYRFTIDGTTRVSLRARMNYVSTGSNPVNPFADYNLELFRRETDGSLTSLRSSQNGLLLPETLNQNLDPGRYLLRVQRVAGRGDYTLTLRTVTDTVSDTFANAVDVGPALLGPNVISRPVGEWLGGRSTDPDYYRFSLNRRVEVDLQLSGITRPATVTLLGTSDTNVLGTGNYSPTTSTPLRATLNPGTYVFRVDGTSNGLTQYGFNLSTSDRSVGQFDLGGNPGAPRNLTLGFRTTRIEEFVGNPDPADLYTFTAPRTGQLRLNLTGLIRNVDYALFSGSSLITSQTAGPNTPGQILLDVTQGTQYSLEINRLGTGNASNTGYVLTGSIRPTDQAGDTFENATTIVNTSTSFPFQDTFFDFVAGDGSESDVDFYRLVLDDSNNAVDSRYRLAVGLDRLEDAVTVQLFRESPGPGGSPVRTELQQSSGNPTQVAGFDGTLGEGTYYLRIIPGSATAASTYELSVSVEETRGIPSLTRNVALRGDAEASNLRNLQGSAFFTAFDGSTRPTFQGGQQRQQSLWRSNGTLDTTLRVGLFDSIANLSSAGDTLYFTADAGDGQGSRLWRWQPSVDNEVGTVTPIEDATGPVFTAPDRLVVVGNAIVFRATVNVNVSGQSRQETRLFWSNGTQVEELENSGLNWTNFVAVGNDLYYVADPDTGATGPGGTPIRGGTVLYQIAGAGNGTVNPGTLTATIIGGGTFGTVLPRNPINLTPIANEDRNNDGFANDGFSLFFIANDDNANLPTPQLNRLDLARLGTQTNPLTVYPSLGTEAFGRGVPWGGLVRAQERNGTLSTTDDQFYVYFTADGPGQLGNELWRINLATNVASLAANLAPDTDGTASSNPANLTVATAPTTTGNDIVLFTADDGTVGTELWALDGTTASTPTGLRAPTLVRDIENGSLASNPLDLTVAGNFFYFTAETPLGGSAPNQTGGRELWEINLIDLNLASADNSAALRLLDIRRGATGNPPVPNASNPQQLTNVAGRLYFTADNGVDGREVWSV